MGGASLERQLSLTSALQQIFTDRSHLNLLAATLLPLLLLAVKLYRLAFCRLPYEGIPHHRHSLHRLLGDLPSIIEDTRRLRDPAKVTLKQFRQLGSPIIQLFIVPLSRPFVFVGDTREVETALSERTTDFYKSPSMTAAFRPLIPGASICKTDTAMWKQQSRLWTEIISLNFLRDVAAPLMYKSALELVELFQTRAKVADGRPFWFGEDFKLATFDVIWTSMLGSELHGLRNEREAILAGTSSITQPESKDQPAQMCASARAEEYEASAYFLAVVAKTLTSPIPNLHQWFLRQAPAFRRHWAVKSRFQKELIESSRRRFADLEDHEAYDEIAESRDVCALDRVLRKVSRLRQKNEGQSDAYLPTTQEVYDELFLLLMSGHETTATALCWCAKILTNNPHEQMKLRQALQAAHPEARMPSVEAILAANIPYLDASLEELLRLANIIPEVVRESMHDATVLGHHIPKNTIVVFSTTVGGNRPFKIPENLRTAKRQGSNMDGGTKTYYDEKMGMGEFHPERWISHDGKFDSRALPRLAFSTGPRSCFGKKFAMKQLRVMITLLVLNFEFQAVPEQLNSWDAYTALLRTPVQSYARLAAV